MHIYPERKVSGFLILGFFVVVVSLLSGDVKMAAGEKKVE